MDSVVWFLVYDGDSGSMMAFRPEDWALGVVGFLLLLSTNTYLSGCLRSHPSTFMKPQTARSKMVSVSDRLVSTGLMKKVSRRSSMTPSRGSLGRTVWDRTSRGAPCRLSGLA